MILLALFILLVLFYSVYVLYCKYYFPEVNELVPTHPGKLPIIGHSYMIFTSEHSFQSLKQFGEFSLKSGGVSKIFLGPATFYILSDPKDVSTVLHKCLDKMFVYKFIEPMLGKMLVAAEVPTWKRSRRILDLGFKQHLLDKYLELFNQQAVRLADELAEEVGKGEVDLTEKITKSVLETTCRTTLGTRLDGKDLVTNKYVEAINGCLEVITSRLLKPWLSFDFIFKRSSYYKRLCKYLETVFALSEQMVQLRKLEHLERLKNKQEFDYTGNKIKSTLDVLIENSVTETGSLFTDVELRNLTDNVLLAAFDTTIYEMLFLLVCVGTYPKVQDKIYQEILQVFGDEQVLSKENLSQLKYLDAVIKESIRLYPISMVLGREAKTDTMLRNVTIPAGCNVIVHMWAVNRNTKYWGPDAKEFKPERWLQPFTLPHHPAAYASFSPGRRGCIGKTYALMYLKATLVPILRKYKITANHTKMMFDVKIMMKPTSGHYVKIEERAINKNK